MLSILSVTNALIPQPRISVSVTNTQQLLPPLFAPAVACRLRCRTPICSMHKAIGLTGKAALPTSWLPGDEVKVMASNGYEYEIAVPDGFEPGDTILFTEAAVPVGAEPGDAITVVVPICLSVTRTGDKILTQLPELTEQPESFAIEVPEGYVTGDIMVVFLGRGGVEALPQADIDWDAAWKSFRAPEAKSSFEEPPLRRSSILDKTSSSSPRVAPLPRAAVLPPGVGPSDQRVIALCVLATLLAGYGALQHALHAGAGFVLLPDGEFGVRTQAVLELNPAAQWYLMNSGS